MQTLTDGERYIPPHVPTAVGTAPFGQRTVLVALSSPRELRLFIDAWKRLGWNVISVNEQKEFVQFLFSGEADLFVTDRLKKLRIIRKLLPPSRLPRTRLVADDLRHAKSAWKAGAEAVMVRSIQHDDFFNYDVVERPDA